MGASIYVAGYPFPIAWPRVRTWFEPGGFDAHQLSCGSFTGAPRAVPECVPAGGFPANVVPYHLKQGLKPHDFRFRRRLTMGAPGKPPRGPGQVEPWGPDALRAAQHTIRQFVLHHDGVIDAESTYHVLHNERGLSAHFILQNDGTIFQTLDLALAAFQCKSLNETSIGIEMNNRGAIKGNTKRDYYDKSANGKWARFEREVVSVTINDSIIETFGFTEEQRKAMHALDHALRRALPNLPPTYPQLAPGHQAWRTLDPWTLQSYAGWLGHYHETSNKWDPGPWDFRAFFADDSAAVGRKVFPLGLHGAAPAQAPELPDDSARLRELSELYYRNNEEGDAGFFPVGRFGDSLLWHTGVHLHAAAGTPVLAPLPGRVVAVQNRAPTAAIGSVNFVLLRHELAVGKVSLRFFSLYMHLGELGARAAPSWTTARPVDHDGTVALHEHDVVGGALLGYVGEAGPDDDRAAQLHFAVFSERNLASALADGSWQLLDGSAGGRLMRAPDLADDIDSSGDGKVSRRELLDFFHAAPEAWRLRKQLLFAPSEWTELPSWSDALASARLPPGQAAQLIEEQIEPTLWWTAALARHAGLPASGEVYHYHPITFLGWLHERLRAAPPDGGIGPASAAAGHVSDLLDDFDDKDGTSFVSESDRMSAAEAAELTLEKLAGGYSD